MKRLPIIPLIIALVALAAAISFGNRVEIQRRQLVDKKECLQHTYLPMLGIDKYLADLRWIWLVQQMGRQTGELDTKAASYFANVIEGLTDLDPNLEQAYQMATMHIAHIAPQQAIGLLKKANQYGLRTNWRWPFLAGHISERYLDRAGVAEDQRLQDAERFFWEAASMDDCPAYVERAWLRLASRTAGDDPVQLLLKQNQMVTELAKTYDDELGQDDQHDSIASESSLLLADTMPLRLASTLMTRARSVISQLLSEQTQQLDAADKAELDKKLAAVRAVYEDMRNLGVRKDAHICANCLTAHGAGEFFCRSCGQHLKAYGYCAPCWKDGRLVLLSGKHCHICGATADNPSITVMHNK